MRPASMATSSVARGARRAAAVDEGAAEYHQIVHVLILCIQ
jgi:hypothetical protein